jgi:hypothetical protein
VSWLASDLALVARIFFWLTPAERAQLGRFLSAVELNGECWEWRGEVTANGYGRFHANGRRSMAHRWLYERLVDAIPDDLVLDHLCRNRCCVNPAHLEPVTNVENARRGAVAARTHCPSGHEYSDTNTRVYRGRRYCRACNNNGGDGRHTTGTRPRAKELTEA